MTAIAEVRQALTAVIGLGAKSPATHFMGLLAQIEAEVGDNEGARTRIDGALELAAETGTHVFDPFLHRLRGDILLKRDLADPGPAEEAYRTAIAIAKQQGARSYQLQAALPLAQLYSSTGRPIEADAVLAPALEGFSPTPEMPEIAEAQALVAALAENEEVKAAEAQRQRRLHLQTAYGQAMMWSKGFAAEKPKLPSRAPPSSPKTPMIFRHVSPRWEVSL
jgi:hypothetical protein